MNDNLIDRTLACLETAVPPGTRVAVFGSQALGSAKGDSDIDLLVIEPAVANRHEETRRLSTLLGRQLIPADVVVMSAATFQGQQSVVNTLAWRVSREGRWHEFAR